MMLTSSTNKPNITPQAFARLSQPDLHAKILNLVANRMQPSNSSLLLQRNACGSCVTASPAAITKRNSLATTRAKQTKHKINQTMCEGYSSLNDKETRLSKDHVKKNNSISNIPHPTHTRELVLKHARKMRIQSKVMSLSIDHAKIGDFTIDLRREMPTQFVNIKMMNKLRLENAEKQRRITQLENQVLELHERIIEMSLSLQQKDNEKGTFSQFSIPVSSMNKISEINAEDEGERRWISEQKVINDVQNENLANKHSNGNDSNYHSMLMMLKIQANQIEKFHHKNEQRRPLQKKTIHLF